MRGFGCFLVAALGLIGPASGARAQVVQLDVAAHFNADVVLNDGTGTLDPTQDPIDLGQFASDNFCFPTTSAATRLAPISPDGLPDDGFFAATARHPDVQLHWRNDDDGLNARRASAVTDSFTISVPPGPYREVHLYFTTGDGTADVSLSLAYATGAVGDAILFVPDWFDDPFETDDAYRLIDGRDRVQVGSGPGTPHAYEESDDPAIFGFRIAVDPSRDLTDIRVTRTDSTGVLSFFGGVAVAAPAVTTSLYESTVARGLLDVANVVATGLTSPFDWTPPPATLLHYFIDDGAGSPALIHVSKTPAGIRFTY